MNSDLNKLEEQIEQWVKRKYRVSLKASIQVLRSLQKEDRPKPCNAVCDVAYKNAQLRKLCDYSDECMKELLQKCAKDRKDPRAIGYLCHQRLSNIVVPHYDHICTQENWYVFIGQFSLCPCQHLKRATDECIGFISEQVRVLGDDDLELVDEKLRASVCAGVFYDAEAYESYGVEQLYIPQLLVIKSVAVRMLEEWLHDINRKPQRRQKLKKWIDRQLNTDGSNSSSGVTPYNISGESNGD